jgi:hypothetical protein
MIETLQIIWNAPIELRVIILAVPVCFAFYYYKNLSNYKYNWLCHCKICKLLRVVKLK